LDRQDEEIFTQDGKETKIINMKQKKIKNNNKNGYGYG
jgi:hypothetical protein